DVAVTTETDGTGWADSGAYPSTAASLAVGARGFSNDAFHQGDIAEIIVFDRDLTDDERTAVETYLDDKYGIAPSPQFIPGKSLWLKADALVANDGDPIADWPDSSGVGFDAVQANANQVPVFHAGAVNGEPAVTFDGVDDTLITDPCFSLFADAAGSLTIVTVFQANDTANQRFLLTFQQNN